MFKPWNPVLNVHDRRLQGKYLPRVPAHSLPARSKASPPGKPGNAPWNGPGSVSVVAADGYVPLSGGVFSTPCRSVI